MAMAFIADIAKALFWNEIHHAQKGKIMVANGLDSPEFIEDYSRNSFTYISAGITMDDTGLVYREIRVETPNRPNQPNYPNNFQPRINTTNRLVEMPQNNESSDFDQKLKKLVNKPNSMSKLTPTNDPYGPGIEGTTSPPSITKPEDLSHEISPIMKKLEELISVEEIPTESSIKEQETRERKTKEIIEKTPLLFKSELFKYQHDHTKIIINALKTHNCSVDASDTGTGKTHCSIVAAKNMGYNIVVMCPKSVIPIWERAGKLHKYEIIKPKNISDLKKMKKRWITVTNYEQFKSDNSPFLKIKIVDNKPIYKWKFPKKTVLIVDECHRAKNHKTQNSKMLYSAHESKIPMMLLSATMIDRIPYMYSIGYLTGLFLSIMQFKQWVKNRKMDNPDKDVSKICLERLHTHIFPDRGSRMTIGQLGDKFPDNNVIYEPCQIGSDNKKIHQIYEKMVERVKKIMESKGDSTCVLTLMLRARQNAELVKVPIIAQMAQDLLDEGKSVAIFLNFNDSIEHLALLLETDCIITGDNPEERQELIDKFQSDKSRIIICNIKAGGVGISLHDLNGNHPRVSIIVPSWSAMEVKQCLGRIARAGAKTKCIQKVLYCPNSIEETIVCLIRKKIKNIDTMNDGPIKNLLDALNINDDFYKSESESESSESDQNDSILCSVIVKKVPIIDVIEIELLFDIKCGNACFDIGAIYEEYKNPTDDYLTKFGIGVVSNKIKIMSHKNFLKRKEKTGDSLAEFITWKKICEQYESEL